MGHEVGLATVEETATEAIMDLSLCWRGTLDGLGAPNTVSPWRGLAERFRSYWGTDPRRIAAVGDVARALAVDVVVVVGLDVLPYLGAVETARRVWYAGDEWAWHHLSQWRLTDPRTWGNIRQATLKGLYERTFARHLDRVWVVSKADRRAMCWALGHDRVDVVPNGVDTAHYRPIVVEERPRSCVFWGRLDFGPNLQALDWFLGRVWPVVRASVPDARFTIHGFRPAAQALAWVDHAGVDLVPDLPDLRAAIARHQVVVLPFVSGGGIKNKLLEAASMGKAIVGSPCACNGLDLGGGASPLVRARRPREWAQALRELWEDADRRRELGRGARCWVVERHGWPAAAAAAMAGLASGADTTVVPLGVPAR